MSPLRVALREEDTNMQTNQRKQTNKQTKEQRNHAAHTSRKQIKKKRNCGKKNTWKEKSNLKGNKTGETGCAMVCVEERV